MVALGALLLIGSAARADEPVPILVEATGTPCADGTPIEEALATRGLAPTRDEAPFLLGVRGTEAEVEVTLVDRQDETLLHRTLPAGSCADVADTVALLVQRRLSGVAWEAPPIVASAPLPAPPGPSNPPDLTPRTPPASPPRPPRRPSIDAVAGLLFATGFSGDAGSVGPTGGVRLRATAPFTAGIAVSRLRHEFVIPTGSVDVDRYPASLHAGWSRRRPELELDVEARVEVETLVVRSRGISDPGTTTRAAVRAGPSVAVATRLDGPLWIVVHAGVLGVVAGYTLVVEDFDGPRDSVPVATQDTAVEIGATAQWRFAL